MARRRKQFHELTSLSQHRARVTAERRYGILSDELEQLYNTGKYNPFARGDPLMRIPEQYREYAYTDEETGEIKVDWSQPAYASMYRLRDLPDVKSYNDETVQFHVFVMASEKVQRIMALMSTDEIREMARFQTAPGEDVELPSDMIVDDITYYQGSDISGQDEWHNIFWYH